MDKLDPCPFCGNYFMQILKEGQINYIFCTQCGARVPGVDFFSGNMDLDTAVRKWNSRYSKEKANNESNFDN